MMTAEKIRERFRQRGETITSWAKAQGYSPNKVYRVLSGIEKGNYGQAHEISVKLGLKQEVADNA